MYVSFVQDIYQQIHIGGSMKEIIRSLDSLSTKIETAKKTVNQLEGRKEELIKRLQKEFEVNTIEEAKNLLQEFKEYEQDLTKMIEKNYKELQEAYKW